MQSMTRPWRSLPISGAFALLALGGCSGENNPRSDAPIKPEPMHGFEYLINKYTNEYSVRRVGTIRSGSHEYIVFDYHYIQLAQCSSCSSQGGQKVLFFEEDRYIGHYHPFDVDVSIKDGSVFFRPISDHQDDVTELKLTERGFPPKLLINGELLGFYR